MSGYLIASLHNGRWHSFFPDLSFMCQLQGDWPAQVLFLPLGEDAEFLAITVST